MRMSSVIGLTAVLLASGLAPSPVSAQEASGSITGRVTSDLLLPLSGVCVDVLGPAGGSAVTGLDGSYAVTGLPAGEYVVAFNLCEEPRAGSAAEFFDDAPSLGTATPVEVLPGQRTSGVDAALEPAAVISGVVTAGDSTEPLPGVCVVAVETEGGLFGFGLTAEDGSYAFENLRGGDYVVLFQHCSEPFTFQAEAFDDVLLPDLQAGQEPTVVSVAAGDERTDVDAALAEGGSVRGTLTALHTGRPVPFVCVALFPAGAATGSQPSYGGFSGLSPEGSGAAGSGDYVIGGVAPGSYTARANPPECADDGYAEQVLGPPASAGEPVLTVAAGDVLTDVGGVLAPLPSISVACAGLETSDPFPDVDPGSTHGQAVACVAGLDIASGRRDGTFGPGEGVRRNQMATFVAGSLEAAGVDLPASPRDAFSDDNGDTHELAINQLAELGVVTGPGGGRYNPSATVSRAQLTSFLVRAYEEATAFPLRADRDRFGDDTGDVHEDNIDKAATAGLTAGRPDGGYSPSATVTRDQMATFMARLVDRVLRDTGSDFFLVASSSEAPAVSAATPSVEQLLRFGPMTALAAERP